MKRIYILLVVTALTLVSCDSNIIEKHILHVVSSGDVHGAWFDEDYSNPEKINTSLLAVSQKVNDLRDSVGSENVLLIDAGDCLQGDVAPYYYNYVKTDVPHLYPRLAKYMNYDCVVVGNHDIETGHPVYDRVRKEMDEAGIPWLGGNTIDENGEIYFSEYKIIEKAGLKVLVLGYTNPNIPAWLQEEKWKGLTFNGLLPYVQQRVDEIKAKENPQVTIVAVHSGSGNGDGQMLENQGIDLFNSLKGVDLIITAHDHMPLSKDEEKFDYMNGGAKGANIGHSVIEVTTKGDKVLEINAVTKVEKVDKNAVDLEMKEFFKNEYEEVKNFSNRKIGTIESTIKTRDAYKGQSLYTNLINTVMLAETGAQVAFTAPLTYNGNVAEGDMRYCDLRIIYPYENELVVIKMKGEEVKGFLEFSYDQWINTVAPENVSDENSHLLKIVERDNPRNNSKGWTFIARSYNFEAAAGLNYVVDVTKPFGNRITINSLADGTPFDLEAFYNVAMTSYRFSGAGDLLPVGAGINDEEAATRLVSQHREIRDLINDFIVENQDVKTEMISNSKVLGQWKFVPENIAVPMLERDMNLLFPNAN